MICFCFLFFVFFFFCLRDGLNWERGTARILKCPIYRNIIAGVRNSGSLFHIGRDSALVRSSKVSARRELTVLEIVFYKRR